MENEQGIKAGCACFVIRDSDCTTMGSRSPFMQWLEEQGFQGDETRRNNGLNPYIYVNVYNKTGCHGVCGCRLISGTCNDSPMSPKDFQTIYEILRKYNRTIEP